MVRWLKIAGVGSLVLLVVVCGGVVWTYRATVRSVPVLEGEVEIPGLDERVTVERDALGVPTIRASNRLDIARALGFVHA